MGSQVVATCRCGVEAKILIGGDMLSERQCYFPCLCEECHDIVQVNLLEKAKQCPICKSTAIIPYDYPQLSKRPGSKLKAWTLLGKYGRELVLTNGNYMCPNCNKLSLRFGKSGVYWF